MGDRQGKQFDQTEPEFSPLAKKLIKATILGRWLLAGLLWLTFGIYGLWHLRAEFPLWRDYLTWAVVRYSLAYHYWASLALVFCVAYTCAILVWHSQKLLQGWSARERYRLEKEAEKIAKNPRHWLWLLIKQI